MLPLSQTHLSLLEPFLCFPQLLLERCRPGFGLLKYQDGPKEGVRCLGDLQSHSLCCDYLQDWQ